MLTGWSICHKNFRELDIMVLIQVGVDMSVSRRKNRLRQSTWRAAADRAARVRPEGSYIMYKLLFVFGFIATKNLVSQKIVRFATQVWAIAVVSISWSRTPTFISL